MKKILTLTAIGALLAVPAVAVQKCVKMDLDDYEFFTEVEHSSLIWSVTSDDPEYTYFEGVALLASDAGGMAPEDSFLDHETYQYFYDDYIVCVCRLLYPYAGKYFVVPYEKMGANSDGDYCAENCSKSFIENSGFRDEVLIPLE